MSNVYETKYTNLMIMTGDEEVIRDWIAYNLTKVIEISEEEGNVIGQAMVPEGTTQVIQEADGGRLFEKTYTAGEFTLAGGQTWELTNSEDITPE